MKYARGLVVLLVALVVAPARAGHEAPLYPSYYPQEIRIEAMGPDAAARQLESSKIHAYLGREPRFAGPAPKSVRSVESLGSFRIARVNPLSPVAKDERAACEAMGAVVARSREAPGVVFHPYPVNGLHGDYLHHADLALLAKERWRVVLPPQPTGLKVWEESPDTKEPVEWDVAAGDVELARLTAPHGFGILGWQGPPWLKQGWFHAYLLLAPSLADPAVRAKTETLFAHLQAGTFATAADRINAERELVSGLAAGCRTVVVGYAAKKDHYSAEYSEGIENIAFDSHAGLNAPIFLRTVKLKDFPWNGWLRLGTAAPPAAAWNPLGGFSDEAGRLIWSAISDPALFPEPYGAGWVLNRIGDVRAGSER